MIRHIVTFRFRAEDPEGRAEAAGRLRAALEPLAGTNPRIQPFEIGIDNGSVPGHWDAALVSLHDSYDALAAYQVHPAHQAALEVIGELVSDKTVVDHPLAG